MPYRKTNCPAILVTDFDQMEAAPAGAIQFGRDSSGAVCSLIQKCPGCGQVSSMRIGENRKPAESPSWLWNGDREKPTLTPSVHHLDCWHGWLRAGQWESC